MQALLRRVVPPDIRNPSQSSMLQSWGGITGEWKNAYRSTNKPQSWGGVTGGWENAGTRLALNSQ